MPFALTTSSQLEPNLGVFTRGSDKLTSPFVSCQEIALWGMIGIESRGRVPPSPRQAHKGLLRFEMTQHGR